MNIEEIKDKKPWWLPKSIWNMAVNSIANTVKSNLRIDVVAKFTADAAMDGLSKAVDGKDDKTVELVCTTIAHGGEVFVKAATAARDKVITADERKDVGTAIGDTINALVPQSAIDAKVDELRAALII